ncbi:aminodeoxychorismate synthase component I [Microbacterium ulmi]|uniref:Aminodeoxychorismate synthase component I n=1 Tax=Microbacterium ulmi TaxID=179095 RepID=A0A7Y2LX18_9MICO|nr:aminodeoxychorismate synthase component I [Microbacterium ulmi]NII71099.1 anthranilate synthase component 1 [Microbacterium ulmi]NNH02406.1 aminodeoxychorismate synthase component I [Microbacterium ulmi]
MIDPLTAVRLDGWTDPERVFLGGPARHPHAFWLDAGPFARAGWSVLGIGEPEPLPGLVRAVVCRGAVDPSWPAGPFRGGWVGWLGYEDAAARAGAPVAPDDGHVPQAMWLRVDRFVAFDHAAGCIWAVAPASDALRFASEVTSWRDALPDAAASAAVGAQAVARNSPSEYAALIERCRDAIREGDAYQLCLTTRFGVAGAVDPVATYRRLRAATPTHHGGLLRTGAVALASASPERFLDVADGIVRTRPIKGTRPRGRDPEEDAVLAAELLASEKERAENVMIVDLMRNDLSRVCEPGSVAAERLLEVESYPAVHQLVSTVAGRLVPGTTVGDLLDAAFPAGSMTGAPKLSAMTILHELEGMARGVFSGCFGWVGDDGALDLAMVIRSVVTHPGGAYVGAGGGITWRSDAAAEVAEVGVKARGPLAALGAELPPGW